MQTPIPPDERPGSVLFGDLPVEVRRALAALQAALYRHTDYRGVQITIEPISPDNPPQIHVHE